MSLVPCFIDESGRDELAKVFAIAGVIATQGAWLRLELPWRRALRDFNVTEYKFRRVARWQRSWKREALHDRLSDLLVEHRVFHLGLCLPIADYNASLVKSGFACRVKKELKYLGQPYTLGAMHLTVELKREARDWLRDRHQFPAKWGQNIAPVFCSVRNETNEFASMIYPRMNSELLLNPVTVSTVDQFWELQVADFIVGQYRHSAEDFVVSGQWRPTPAMVKTTDSVITFKHWHYDNFEAFRSGTETELRVTHPELFEE
jgi:hypothetical protein